MVFRQMYLPKGFVYRRNSVELYKQLKQIIEEVFGPDVLKNKQARYLKNVSCRVLK